MPFGTGTVPPRAQLLEQKGTSTTNMDMRAIPLIRRPLAELYGGLRGQVALNVHRTKSVHKKNKQKQTRQEYAINGATVRAAVQFSNLELEVQ